MFSLSLYQYIKNNNMYYTLNWKLIAISSLIIVTHCQPLKQEIGEECTNKNGRVGICQLKNKCSKANDLGAICNSEKSLICCTKIINKRSNLSNNQNEGRNTFITDFYQVPISQNPTSNINIYSFNVDKEDVPDFVSSSNTKLFVENRPVQNFDQNKVTHLHNNTNNNQNIEVIIDNDGDTTKITKNNYNYPNYETQRPNQNQNQKNTYPNYQVTTNKNRPYYDTYPANQNNNNNRPYQETYQSNQNNNFNLNPNDYTSTQKPQDNSGDFEYNSQFTNSKTNTNNYEVNKRPNQSTNYRPTSSILFPSNFEDTKYTTTTNKYQNRPNANTKRISEIKCEEYSKPLTTTISALDLSIGTAPKPLSIEKCDSKSVTLIVGGTKAYLGEFPHMAAVGFNVTIGNPWNCGGTLISDQFVLTAAHCTHSSLGNPVRVRLGDLNLEKTNDGANPIEFLVDEIFKHPDYVSTSKYNDIALLRLDKKVKFNNNIRPACLYNNEKIYARKVTATGWGSIGYGEQSSDELLKVNLDIIDNSQCNKLYEAESKSKTLNRGIIDSMICAGELAGGRDTCLGDSGGPLVLRSEKNACVFNLIGITSFGKFCATENAPGVYTKVSAFLPWIEQIVWS